MRAPGNSGHAGSAIMFSSRPTASMMIVRVTGSPTRNASEADICCVRLKSRAGCQSEPVKAAGRDSMSIRIGSLSTVIRRPRTVGCQTLELRRSIRRPLSCIAGRTISPERSGNTA